MATAIKFSTVNVLFKKIHRKFYSFGESVHELLLFFFSSSSSSSNLTLSINFEHSKFNGKFLYQLKMFVGRQKPRERASIKDDIRGWKRASVDFRCICGVPFARKKAVKVKLAFNSNCLGTVWRRRPSQTVNSRRLLGREKWRLSSGDRSIFCFDNV